MLISDILERGGSGIFVGSLILGFTIAGFADKKNSIEYPAPEGEMLFRRRFADRAPFAMMGVAILGGPIFYLGLMFDPHAVGGSLFVWVLYLFITLFAIFLVRMFFNMAGPEELHLNLGNRTYRRGSGSLLFPTVTSGSWQDMYGVFVRRVGPVNSSRTVYRVGIRWLGNSEETDIGRYERSSSAEWVANDLQEDLDLPRVAAPP